MQIRNSLIVYRKELRDMLRDKRTIRSMIIVPVIAMPLIIVGITKLASRLEGEAKKQPSKVMISGGQDSPKTLAALQNAPDIEIVPYQSDAKQEVSDKTIGALVEIPAGFDSVLSNDKTAQVSIGYYQNDDKSELAKGRLQQFFDEYRDKMARAALTARGMPTNLLEPFTVTASNIAPPSKVSAAAIGGWILYMVIIFSFSGAMYPAMDTTAGEKERGTLETILSSPVSRTDLVLGKFLMVMTVSIVTTALSLTSMGASIAWAGRSAGGGADAAFKLGFDPSSIIAIVILLVPLAVLFAVVEIAVALLAKSYREAQTYVSPLMFLVIVPAIVGALPGVELNWKTALIPILNVSLVSKEIFAATYHWSYIALIFATTCIYAAIGIAAAVHMFNREDVLFRT
ncbi:MAG TPA: ABC transporter permease [Candidatus Acidoferrales bacterium]|nr:ABC transporter permease [Candidatus Acidoferrales bacterium]